MNHFFRYATTALGVGAAALLVPTSWILGPFLSLLGFGLAGPVKGALKPYTCARELSWTA